jgi:RimJ/RimL family protein N-acetyltransferase
MRLEPFVLEGRSVRLEPLELRHVPGLLAAAAGDPELYRWTTVPRDDAGMRAYVESALRGQETGEVIPFATLRGGTDEVIGSTRFFDIEWWPWPDGHPHHGRLTPDVCEIGYTWLKRDAIRTAANTEAKWMMLRHAFEVWKVHRVCLHTDERNARSRAAIERIGGRFEGILRAHRMASDLVPRNSARYSITATEWPGVRERLRRRLH